MNFVDSVANAEELQGQIIFKIECDPFGNSILIECASGLRVRIYGKPGDNCYCNDYCFCDRTPVLIVEKVT